MRWCRFWELGGWDDNRYLISKFLRIIGDKKNVSFLLYSDLNIENRCFYRYFLFLQNSYFKINAKRCF